MTKEIAEFAYDLHSGLGTVNITEYDQLPLLGMAATLAVHIKGLGSIDYEVLRKVSDHFMGIPSHSLKETLKILEEVEFVRLVTSGRTIEKIIPNIPLFDDVYVGLGEFSDSELKMNEHEQATLSILQALREAPQNTQSFQAKSGIDRDIFRRCLEFGSISGMLSEQKARGKNILISPFYYADNLDGLADTVAAVGAPALSSVLEKVKANQGWPLSLATNSGQLGSSNLSQTEIQLLTKLTSEGIIKPPTISFGGKQESFVFTPKPGSARLNAANREIYERAMALVSAVRKGQLLADRYRIHSPIAILRALRDRGYIKSNSEASAQYQNLVVMRVAHLKEVSNGRWQLHLNRTQENESALNLAIDVLKTGEVANMEVNQDARIALTKDEVYIQSIVAAAELKRKQKDITDPQAVEEYTQLMLKFD
ncbi:hypothetical protein B6V74_01985 [Thioclava sp. F42-5]|uniref:hypothetical protein n=1 Tax=Thioclava sp. F42-5 TaxID=1973005 RepID=UPI000B54203F|nr:hypothetical protein [Thioclava sp. F42-5]OWY10821.1 hypothetical protein B6V74_01985 [Thioclava sp. F42-5]